MKRKNVDKVWFIASIIFIFCLAANFIVAAILKIQLTQNCIGHLKRAADANTIDLAKSELEIAITYLENNKLTEGSTHWLYATPENDIGFWYKNIKAAYIELDSMPTTASQLEKTNVLMKLRETLLDEVANSTMVTYPPSLNVYPYVGLFNSWLCITVALSIVCFILSKY